MSEIEKANETFRKAIKENPGALADLTKQVDIYKKQDQYVIDKSNQLFTELQTQEVDINSKILGTVCAELDAKFGIGENLVLEWLIDKYVAVEVERRVYPWFEEIYKTLVERDHNEKNKFDYFPDQRAFYVKTNTPTLKVVVFGNPYKDSVNYLVIDKKEPFIDDEYFHKFCVRRIWPKLRKDSIGSVLRPTLAYFKKNSFINYKTMSGFYGDCRDSGHILTYDKLPRSPGRTDHSFWTMNEIMRWFLEVNFVHTALEEKNNHV